MGTMVNAVSTANAVATSSAQAGSNTTTVNLLKGLITASSVNTAAKVLRSGSTFTYTGSTQFLALKVAGASISASVPPNTRVNLPGLGYVVLNDQIASSTSTSAYDEVNGLLLVVTTANSYNLPVGARGSWSHTCTRRSTAIDLCGPIPPRRKEGPMPLGPSFTSCNCASR